MTQRHTVVVVGAGAAGIGVGVALQRIGVPFVILERGSVGESFKRWPAEMRFITPSFNSNGFGQVDLNAVTPDTSPAFTLRKERLSGMDYARYLDAVARHFELPIQTGVDVRSLQPIGGDFALHTSDGPIHARFVIWAAGEFQYPRLNGFRGASLCLHNSQVRSWQTMPGKEYIVIGGYESGIDAAVQLAALGKRVRVFDGRAAWDVDESDPSVSLSPYTYQRLRRAMQDGRIELVGGVHVTEVMKQGRSYAVRTDDGNWHAVATQPILATGFEGSLRLIASLFDWREDGQPHLNEVDESTITPNLFVVGPGVRHDRHIFCFIYKFRQRFAVVANAIGARLGLDTRPLEIYRRANMFLDDLSCCGAACACG
ncbi:MAG: NAD(P)-binding domain-containing protein [Anaerolineae bacterium]|nr:NAD(P)-binding domain-containing protein [Candidatus Roseilinea sp.]MDW8451543.1 NAD(P)-binding domain-containing protein [Anaerolineae bacterium]